MLAIIVASADTRDAALAGLRAALTATHLDGIETNVPFLVDLVTRCQPLLTGRMLTRDLAAFDYVSTTVGVLHAPPGAAIVVDLGRPDLWKAGVPPSGPADDLAFRAANALVGNAADAAGLELLLEGVSLKFEVGAWVAVTGATPSPLHVNGQPVQSWTSIRVDAGSTLTIGKIAGPGSRAYVAVSGGGFDVPLYLGSRTTFTLGAFGGHQGRALRTGDVLRLFDQANVDQTTRPSFAITSPPSYSNTWRVGALEGPHSDGFMTTADFLFDCPLRVHYNSNRLGVRLEGAPAPEWTRADGGDAGLHPSNVLDTVYSHNAVNITGELPVFLGVDGPSLGGFVCPLVVARAEAWKFGQVRPGDTVTFYRVARPDALAARARMLAASLDNLAVPPATAREPPILFKCDGARADVGGRVVVRLAGEDAVLVEYGSDDVIDLPLRLAVRGLADALAARFASAECGLREMSPGVRSLHVAFDPARMQLPHLLAAVSAAVTDMPVPRRVPSRMLHLPLAFDASTTRAALARYAAGVRANAPYLPSNIDFVARINGMEPDAVQNIVFAASYLVLGLGDVYLGAPCALPVDPRHRLTTTKMNPARVWTAEGEVGLGGSFMCVYGMDSPGGYQLIGRTVMMWDTWARDRTPWLLHDFDQVRFYPVSEDDLDAFRAKFARGAVALRIEDTEFDVDDYNTMLSVNNTAITADRDRKRVAFEAERARWAEAEANAANKDATGDGATAPGTPTETEAWPEDAIVVTAPVAGRFTPALAVGDTITAHADAPPSLGTLEAMKIEFDVPLPADLAGADVRVARLLAPTGTIVDQGEALMLLLSASSAKDDADDGEKSSSVDVTSFSFASVDGLLSAYKAASLSVTDVALEAHRRAVAAPTSVFLYIAPLDDLLARAAELDAVPATARGSLHGVPVAVKDNVDVAGMPTTAACVDVLGTAPTTRSSVVVARLLDAGAIIVGKTNMDQFATGLTGQRSPQGPVACASHPDYIAGGSSSGSGVAVALDVVTAALGTDTAGSGRVPAALNGVVGYKPTRGLLPATGVVPACASLDCVTVFAATCGDARAVACVAAGWDAGDPYSRPAPAKPLSTFSPSAFRYGVLPDDTIAALVDDAVRAGLAVADAACRALGGTRVVLEADDAATLLETARLLYAKNSPWVAERCVAVGAVLDQAGVTTWDALHPVVRAILDAGRSTTAVDAWELEHQVQAARARVAARVWRNVDVLLLPTVPRTYTIADVAADPVATNAHLGTFTNFCNLLDMAAVAVPASTDSRGLPVGVQLVAPAWCDDDVLELGHALHVKTSSKSVETTTAALDAGGRVLPAAAARDAAATFGNDDTAHGNDAAARVLEKAPPGEPCVDVFVVGAHLAGQPLNHQLTSRGATLARVVRTAPTYKLFVLEGGKRPGLVRAGAADTAGTAAIEGEVWRVPVTAFGSFVADCVVEPLAMGSVVLHDDSIVKGFICEAAAVENAADVTALGGWRAYVAA